MSECCKCHGECGLNTSYCDACSIDMIADIYPCQRCNKPLSRSSYDWFGCKDCATEEEKQYIIEHWPENKHKP